MLPSCLFSKPCWNKICYMKCTMMKWILALLSWGLICIPKEPEAFTFAKMEVGHPVKSAILTDLEALNFYFLWVFLHF